MSVENTQDTAVSIPGDFAAYEQFRATGKLPESEVEDTEDVDENETPSGDDSKETSETAADSETEDDTEHDEDAEDGDGEEDGEDEDVEEKPKKKGGFKKRIDKLNAKIEALERALAGKPAVETTEQAAAADKTAEAELTEPDPEKFDDYNAYLREFAKYSIAAERREAQRRDALVKEQEAHNAVLETFATRVNEFAKANPDFKTTVGKSTTPITAGLQQLICESEHGPHILFDLARANPAEVQRLNALPPLALAKEIGKREAAIAASKAPKPTPTASKAPVPPKSASGRSGVTRKPLTEVDDFSEYETRRRAGHKR